MRALLFKRVIFVFQMGKVGSTSTYMAIWRSFEKQEERRSFEVGKKKGGDYLARYGSKWILFHSHRVSLNSIYSLSELYKLVILWRVRLGLPVRVVCPIREPISRDVSLFFFARYTGRGAHRTDPHLMANDDQRKFEELFLATSSPQRTRDLAHIIGTTDSQSGLDWFDKHFKPLIGIDVYKQPFPINRKWQIYKRGFIRVLLYRVDLKPSEQAKLISRFLGIRLDEIEPQNTARDNGYAEHYSQFRESVKLPEQYIRLVHGSRFARHFWSPVELKATADKWRGVSGS